MDPRSRWKNPEVLKEEANGRRAVAAIVKLMRMVGPKVGLEESGIGRAEREAGADPGFLVELLRDEGLDPDVHVYLKPNKLDKEKLLTFHKTPLFKKAVEHMSMSKELRAALFFRIGRTWWVAHNFHVKERTGMARIFIPSSIPGVESFHVVEAKVFKEE